jgi:hypothetical protein
MHLVEPVPFARLRLQEKDVGNHDRRPGNYSEWKVISGTNQTVLTYQPHRCNETAESTKRVSH